MALIVNRNILLVVTLLEYPIYYRDSVTNSMVDTQNQSRIVVTIVEGTYGTIRIFLLRVPVLLRVVGVQRS